MSGTKSGGIAVLVFAVAGLGGRAVAADGAAAVPGRPAADAREGVVGWLAPEPVLSVGQREEVEALSKVIDAGDARAVPTIVRWLAAEQDRQRVGFASPRLAEAMRGAAALRVAEAAPWLAAIWDDPTAMPDVRRRALTALVRIDPAYSQRLLRGALAGPVAASGNVLARGPAGDVVRVDGRVLRLGPPAAAAAAAALADHFGDDAARRALVGMYPERAGVAGPDVSPRADPPEDGLAFFELARSRDAGVAELLGERAAGLAGAERKQAEALVDQVRLNGTAEARLIAIAADPTEPDARRAGAVAALGWHGGAGAVAPLDGFGREPRWADVWGRANPQSKSIGRPQWAADEIRRRLRQGRAAGAYPPPFRAPALLAGDADAHAAALVDGAPPRVYRRAGESVVSLPGGAQAPRLTVFDLRGRAHAVELRYAGAAVYAAGRRALRETAVAVGMTPDGQTAVSVEPVDDRAGEATPEGYLFVERTAETDAGVRREAVVLQRLGRRVTARVPNRTAPDGKPVPDSAVMAAFKGLAAGDVVEARLERAGGLPMVTWAAPYRPTVGATFVGHARVRDAAGRERAAVDVELAGRRRVKCLLPDADGPGPKPLIAGRLLGRLVAGMEVRVAPEEDLAAAVKGGGALRVRDVWVDGEVQRLPGGVAIRATSGRASVTLSGAKVGAVSPVVLRSPDDEAYRLGTEAGRLVSAGAKARIPGRDEPLDAERRTKLRGALSRVRVVVDGGARARMAEVLRGWQVAVDPGVRRAAEQEVCVLLQEEQARVLAVDGAGGGDPGGADRGGGEGGVGRGVRAPTSPDLVTVLFGGNDWDNGVGGERFGQYLRAAVEQARRQTCGSADVLIMSTCPAHARWETYEELEDAARTVAAEMKCGYGDVALEFRRAAHSE